MSIANRAATEFGCSVDDVQVGEIGAKCNYLATGCGLSAIYIAIPYGEEVAVIHTPYVSVKPQTELNCCPEGNCMVTRDSEVKEAGAYGTVQDFGTTADSLASKSDLINLVKARTYPDTKITNEEAMKIEAPHGYWTAHAIDDEHWEVRYSKDAQIFKWTVNIETWSVELFEDD